MDGARFTKHYMSMTNPSAQKPGALLDAHSHGSAPTANLMAIVSRFNSGPLLHKSAINTTPASTNMAGVHLMQIGDYCITCITYNKHIIQIVNTYVYIYILVLK